MQRRTFLLGLPLLAAACSGEEVWAPDDVVSRSAYRHDGPPRVTLFTMKNTGSDNGAHTGMMVNASQRIIFDPAGTFGHSSIPERNDVLFGITPQIEQFYITYHSRITYYTVIQELDVPAGSAEQVLRLCMGYGAVPKAGCTRATSDILRQTPGFEDIRMTFFPDNLEKQFDRKPGVRRSERRETDSDDKTEAAAAFDELLRSAQ